MNSQNTPTFLELYDKYMEMMDEYDELKMTDPTNPKLEKLKKESTQIFEEARKIVESGT